MGTFSDVLQMGLTDVEVLNTFQSWVVTELSGGF